MEPELPLATFEHLDAMPDAATYLIIPLPIGDAGQPGIEQAVGYEDALEVDARSIAIGRIDVDRRPDVAHHASRRRISAACERT